MNLNNLIKEVYALGFESEKAVNDTLLGAINRSLMQIFTDFPSERAVRLLPNVPTPNLVCEAYAHTPSQRRDFHLNGLAFCFKVSGEGEVIVTDENGERSYKFNTPYGTVRDFISGDATLSFVGAYRYTVSALVSYSEITSADRERIPEPSEWYEINMTELVDDFLFFSRLPLTRDMTPIQNSKINGERLFIPITYKAEAVIYYNRAPRKANIDTPEQELDIPECCTHLLPLIVASYVWLEDDSDTAAYYMSLYRDGMNRIKSTVRAAMNTEFVDVLRWA